jgi:CubicO group peptidase (beta-lactamase class C family)
MKNIFLFLLLFISSYSYSQQETTLSTSKPEKMDMSLAGLNKIDSLMLRYVNEKKLPGMITMVARHGIIVKFEKYGLMDVDKPMELNAIFRIASMTKPITSVAAMILYEEGYFQLDDPVAKYIPEFKDLKVFSYKDKNGIHVEEQNMPMTIRNLLTHTSGLASSMEDSPVDSLYRVADLSNAITLKDLIQKLAKLPLKYQPGTRWQYGESTDVLGYLVEVLSGKPLDVFFKERIFTPLKMVDTDYSVPDEKLYRVSKVYGIGQQGMEMIKSPEVNNVSDSVKRIRGNGGLISTATDYMIFSQMILNKGIYNGVRILKSNTVDLMTSNQLSNIIMPDDDFLGKLMLGMGFGLGFAIVQDENKANTIGTSGSYWWSGTANTYFYIDPKKDLIMIFMTQFVPNYYYPVFKEIRELVYKSIKNK